MAGAATTTVPAQRSKAGAAAAPAPIFTRSARELVEVIPFDQSNVLTTSTQGPFSIEVPAVGYLRSVLLLVTLTGGVGSGVTAGADGPTNVIRDITLRDVGGNPIIEPITGWELEQINLWGGYAFNPNPRVQGSFSAVDGNGNGQFLLRVPVEILSRDAYGALQNMNAAQPYRIEYRIEAAANVYGTVPTTLPTVRVRAVAEVWTDPGFAPGGLGVQQFWTKQVYTINAGTNTLKLTRQGNLLRNLILIHRDNSGVRQTAMMPDPLTVQWDKRQLNVAPRMVRNHYLTERYGFTAATIPNGVDCLEFTHDFDGHPGGELRDLWLPTSQATRFELQGSFANAGTLTVLTNDVLVPAGVVGAAAPMEG